jgi:hypothetical protein
MNIYEESTINFWIWTTKLIGGKKKYDSEFLSYNLMLDSGKKIRALRDKKKEIF